MRGRCLHVHDDPRLQIDEVVGRVGEERRAAWGGSPACGGIGERDVLRSRWRIGRVSGTVTRRVVLLEGCEVLANRAGRTVSLVPVDDLGARHSPSSVGVGLDDAGIDRKAFATDQALAHAAPQHALEYVTEGVALAEATVTVLGEGRVVGHRSFEIEPAEPAIRKVQLNLLAQTALGADAKAVADDQHPDHQLRVDRRASRVAVERCEMAAQLAKLEEAIDATQQVAARNVIVEVEGVEESVLAATSVTHHLDAPVVAMGLKPSEK